MQVFRVRNDWRLLLALLGGVSAGIVGCGESQKSRKATEATNRGLANYQQKKYDAAIKDYTEALDSDPSDAVIYYNRGLAYADAGRRKEAIADFTRALEKKPDYVPALAERSRAYVTDQQYRKAQRDVERAKKLDPNADVDNVPKQLLESDTSPD